MSDQEKYQRAKQAGYSDQEIMDHLAAKDPEFEQKMMKAQEAGYSPEEVLGYFNSPQKDEELGFGDYATDFAQQGAQGVGIGALGSYGDIFDLLGLQGKEMLPMDKAKYDREADILGKVNKGEKLSLNDIKQLSDTDESSFLRLPSSQDVEEFGKQTGLVSEPKTAAGRYAKRIGRFGGASLSFGGGSINSPIAAGLAGQTLEELGAPPWMQAAAEIIAAVKASPKTNVPITSKSKEIQKTIENLTKSGFSQQDITLAKNALEEKNILKKVSKQTEASKKAFLNAEQNVQKNFDKILESSFKGITTEGPDAFKNISSEIFDNLEKTAKTIPVSITADFASDLNTVVKGLEKTLAQTPQEKSVISFLKTAIESARPKFKGGRAAIPPSKSNILDEFGKPLTHPGTPSVKAKKVAPATGDYYLKFYKGLNAIGQWDNPKQREFVFSKVKDSVKKALQKQGSDGIKLANQLEEANKSWMKYLKAEEVSNLIKKSSTEEGLNFTKLSKSLENNKNFEVLVNGLGKDKASNLKLISDTGKNIKNLDKKISGDQAKQIFGSMKLWELGKAVGTLNFKSLGLILGSEVAGKFATKLLTDPWYQNITLNILKNASQEKWIPMSLLISNLENRLTKEEDQAEPE